MSLGLRTARSAVSTGRACSRALPKYAGVLANAKHIENEGDPAVAHDGCAGIKREPF